MTPENLRFHAAGHLAAASLLAGSGNLAGARSILAVISEFAEHSKVSAPPQVIQKILENEKEPNPTDIALLEQWFVDPLNTIIEKAGG